MICIAVVICRILFNRSSLGPKRNLHKSLSPQLLSVCRIDLDHEPAIYKPLLFVLVAIFISAVSQIVMTFSPYDLPHSVL
jgi:hypothetical protein